MRTSWLIMVLIGMGIVSCEIKPQPISYGKDVCKFCSMIIIDQQHGSEVITNKGRVYKFDSIECLINYSHGVDESDIAMKLCNHYNTPGELIQIEDASFLISEGIPSPMGAFLTAFDEKNSAMSAKEKHGGNVYSWNELLEHWKDHYVYYE